MMIDVGGAQARDSTGRLGVKDDTAWAAMGGAWRRQGPAAQLDGDAAVDDGGDGSGGPEKLQWWRTEAGASMATRRWGGRGSHHRRKTRRCRRAC
jgi:hypothetical protein